MVGIFLPDVWRECTDFVVRILKMNRNVGEGTTQQFNKSQAVETSHHLFHFIRNIRQLIFDYCVVRIYCVLLMYISL
jgi:type IV secretory pathway TrbF-like protein